MTAELIKQTPQQIKICKSFSKGVGWVAGVQVKREGKYLKCYGHQFFTTKPATEEDAQRNYKKKDNWQIYTIPDTYNGVLLSDSIIEGRRTERWYWLIEDGFVIENSSDLEDLGLGI